MYVSQGTSPTRPITPSPLHDIRFSNLPYFTADRQSKRRGSLGHDSHRRLISGNKSAMRERPRAHRQVTGSFVRLMQSEQPLQRERGKKEDLSKGFELLWQLKGRLKRPQEIKLETKVMVRKVQVSVKIPNGEHVDQVDCGFAIPRHNITKRPGLRSQKSSHSPGLLPFSLSIPGLLRKPS